MKAAKKRISTKRHQQIVLNAWCWAFLSVTLIFYVAFMGWPIISSIYYSFLDWSGLTANAKYVGLDNYRKLFQDKLFWNAFQNSFRYTVILVPLQLAVSLFLAYMLNNAKLKGKNLYRAVWFLPVITTSAVVGIIMVFIWSENGPINSMMTFFQLFRNPINFLGNSRYAMGTVIAISIWKDSGIYMIYWLAGLQSVPTDLYEAAALDGAGRGQTFYYVVLPMIAPTAGIIAILCTLNSLKVFDIVQTMTGGGPYYATDVIGTFVYRTAFSSTIGMPRIGYASAATILFGVVVIVMGLVLNWVKSLLQKKRG
ncbi:MAG: sugar ABC transporter permease [Hungatella hathewayi]|nr:sugar ABC transporter permease [Hungatella hathewayi]